VLRGAAICEHEEKGFLNRSPKKFRNTPLKKNDSRKKREKESENEERKKKGEGRGKMAGTQMTLTIRTSLE